MNWLASPSVRRGGSVALVWFLIAALGLFLGMAVISRLVERFSTSFDLALALTLVAVAALAFGYSVLLVRGRVVPAPWKAVAIGSLPFLILGLRGGWELIHPQIPDGLEELMSADWRTYAIAAVQLGLGVGVGAPVASAAASLLGASNRRIEPTASGSINQ